MRRGWRSRERLIPMSRSLPSSSGSQLRKHRYTRRATAREPTFPKSDTARSQRAVYDATRENIPWSGSRSGDLDRGGERELASLLPRSALVTLWRGARSLAMRLFHQSLLRMARILHRSCYRKRAAQIISFIAASSVFPLSGARWAVSSIGGLFGCGYCYLSCYSPRGAGSLR